MPLAFIVPFLFKDANGLEKLLRWYMLLALAVCGLGVAQFFAPPSSPLNLYASQKLGEARDPDEHDVAVFGEEGLVRVTGTFSYITGYTYYLTVILAFLLPLLGYSRKAAWRIIVIGLLALVLGNVAMSGTRATAVGAAIVLLGFSLISLFYGLPAERSKVRLYLLAAAVGVVSCFLFFERAVTAFQSRVEGDWESGKRRAWAAVAEPLAVLGEAGVFGHGTVIGQPAVAGFRRAMGLPAPRGHS
jgi:hypothetical protein